jgi:DNA repair protein RecO (recombination protein O)
MRRLPLYKTEAIVLNSRKAREAERDLSLYTLSFGKMEMKAKGARKPKSRFSAIEPFSHIELSFWWGDELCIMREAKILSPFSELREDLSKIETASFIVRSADELTEPNHPEREIFYLLRDTLLWLTQKDTPFIKSFFSLKLLSALGLSPQLSECVCCKRPIEDAIGFSPKEGGIVCPEHRENSTSISQPAIYVMKRLIETKIEQAKRITLAWPLEDEIGRLSNLLLKWHIAS